MGVEIKAQKLKAGGALGAGMVYVERPADTELPAALRAGEFCYVLAPRQSGKSSLRARTEAAISQAGVRCAAIDLTRIGVRVSIEEWYYGIVEELADRLGLPGAPAFWEGHREMPPVQRWLRYLRDGVLHEVPGPVVIFIDEIDTVLALDLPRDDFFAAIRAIYNQRADEPIYDRLTFCLLGVASPADLMRDPRRTPFNVGRGVALADFTAVQAQAFLPSLLSCGGDPRALLDAVMSWTEGHPYMTHRLCAALSQEGRNETIPPEERVRALVREVFLRRGQAEETCLAVSDSYFNPSQNRDAERIGPMLGLYRRLLDGERVPVEKGDAVQTALRLTGLAAEREDQEGVALRVRNRIFGSVFDEEWRRAREGRRPDTAITGAEEDVAPGILIGRYRVLRKIEVDSIGEVFAAEDTRLRRRVAIKVLHRHFSREKGMATRLFREALAVSRISHPGILQVFDFGELPSGLVYLVREYQEGETLRVRLRQEGHLPRGQAVRLGLGIASPLAEAHRYGIVHRDLNPDKILLVMDPHSPSRGEDVKICDFGLAKLSGPEEDPGVSTIAGDFLGTPAYSAPEVYYGDSRGVSDKADVYSLGVMLQEMLTGKPPFMHAFREPRRLLDVPRDLAPLLERMTALNPEDRPPMAQVEEELMRAATGDRSAWPSTLISAQGQVRELGLTPTRLRLLTLMLGLLLSFLAGALAFWLLRK